MAGERFYAEIESGTFTDDSIELIAASNARELSITIEAPWAGDSVSGLGRAATIALPREKVELLRDALNRWLADDGQLPGPYDDNDD